MAFWQQDIFDGHRRWISRVRSFRSRKTRDNLCNTGGSERRHSPESGFKDPPPEDPAPPPAPFFPPNSRLSGVTSSPAFSGENSRRPACGAASGGGGGAGPGAMEARAASGRSACAGERQSAAVAAMTPPSAGLSSWSSPPPVLASSSSSLKLKLKRCIFLPGKIFSLVLTSSFSSSWWSSSLASCTPSFRSSCRGTRSVRPPPPRSPRGRTA